MASKITAKNIVKKYRKMARKNPYTVPTITLDEVTNPEEIDRADTIETLENIAFIQLGLASS